MLKAATVMIIRHILLLSMFSLVSCLTIDLAFAQQKAKHDHGAAKHTGETHGFGFKEYDAFHDVLHPLQHEALPSGDFQSIRTKAGELVAAGKMIAKLSVPKNVKNKALFRTELRRFRVAVDKFSNDSKAGTDEQLKASYVAVHDSFEKLAELLPKP